MKIRVGEYDASGFNSPETAQHEEYTVVRLLKHPQFNAGRLSNDIAILYTDRDINLNKPNVNTACLPSCRDQFGHQFNNGTGVRCWVAGWGKNAIDGSFQMLQHIHGNTEQAMGLQIQRDIVDDEGSVTNALLDDFSENE